MFKKLRLKRRLLIISIPLLLIISAVALYTNGIFFFSEFKPSVEIKYSMDDSAKLKELLDKSLQQSNVALIDRANNIIEIEGVSLNDVKTNVQNLTKDYSGVTYTVKEVSSLSKGSLTALIAGLYLLFLAGLAIHFYFVSSKGGELSIILGSYVILLINLTLGAFISLGLLSLISRFYKITSLDLLLILVGSLLGYLLYYMASININEIKSFQSLGFEFKQYATGNFKSILVISVVLLGIPTVGLGTAFVIHALLLISFLVLSIFIFYWHGYIQEDAKNLKTSFSNRINSIKNIRRKKSSVITTPTSSKKKDKKKKKKNK
ncbi:MAG: hypothetical protein ACMG57_04400 [Candidatus Dojkabacteria bacterium]